MKIGILETGHPPPELAARYGSYGDMFSRFLAGRGLEFAAYPVVDGVFPDSVHDAEGWLITGSRHGVYEDLPWLPRLFEFIREAWREGVPMVGICFGHQAIAKALGGEVEKFPGGWAVGPTEYEGPIGPVRLNAWHQDQVITPPEGAETVLQNAFCRHAGLVYGDKAFSVQAHPEFDNDFLKGLIETRGRQLVPGPLLQDAEERLKDPTSSDGIADTIARFFRQRSLT